jgi:hypothetical protein
MLAKPMAEVEAYRELLRSADGIRMVELGIAGGGSVALFSLLAKPSRLVALELSAERVPALDAFIESRGLGEAVHLHYGVDQADRSTVREIMALEFEGAAPDLVVDDASHRYTETVASFEVLFPRLRPGGDYIIEDWACDHDIRNLLLEVLNDPESPLEPWATAVMAGKVASAHGDRPPQTDVAVAALKGEAGPPPLSLLAGRLVVGAVEPRSGIDSIEVTPYWLRVRRSEADVDPGKYSLQSCCPDHFQSMAT